MLLLRKSLPQLRLVMRHESENVCVMEDKKRKDTLLKYYLHKYLSLDRSKENEEATVESIRNGVEFRGTNLWVLIFATFIASLGLNVNSTAVIIGAMLISPLMGPIMGVGLSVGINDFELMKRSLKNYFIATVFSVTTATVYFAFTPLNEVQSELLARTSPTIYDVFIALVGGLAGIVALATKEKGNVIPGVAIATALMPPLCTAGFGLGTGNWLYFLGAFYLYFINSVFISLATFIGVRVMGFRRKEFVDKERQRLVSRYIIIIAVVTMCPAVYLTYGIVKETIYQSAANDFISAELQFPGSLVLSRDISYSDRQIRVVLLGKEVPDDKIEQARQRMEGYRLDNTTLTVVQGEGNNDLRQLTVSELKSSVMEDFYRRSSQQLAAQERENDSLRQELMFYSGMHPVGSHIGEELRALFPYVSSVYISRGLELDIDSACVDTVTYAVVGCKRKVSRADRKKIGDWLKVRVAADGFKLIIE